MRIHFKSQKAALSLFSLFPFLA